VETYTFPGTYTETNVLRILDGFNGDSLAGTETEYVPAYYSFRIYDISFSDSLTETDTTSETTL